MILGLNPRLSHHGLSFNLHFRQLVQHVETAFDFLSRFVCADCLAILRGQGWSVNHDRAKNDDQKQK